MAEQGKGGSKGNDIMGIIAGTSKILNGVSNGRAAKYIARQERELAKIQYKENRKEIERAYKINFQGALKDYARQKSGLFNMQEKAKTQLNVSLGARANIDKENDSIKTDSYKKIESEVQDNILAMISGKEFELSELANNRGNQIYQIGTNLNTTIAGVNKNEIIARKQADQMIMDGITQIAESGYSMATGGQSMGADEVTSDKSLNYGAETFKAPAKYNPIKLSSNFGKSFSGLSLGNYNFSGTGNKFRW